MSRVGKKPVPLPANVKVNIGEQLQVEGPKGKLRVPIPAGVRIRTSDGSLLVERDGDQYAAGRWLPTPCKAFRAALSGNWTLWASATGRTSRAR
jgi:ribosomal protein L6P/L9E